MLFRSFASFARAALALAVPAVLVASCGARVGIEDYPQPCAAGLTRCGEECVSLQNDLLHCGACNAACFEGTCVGGVCEAFGECPPNSIDCFGVCVDPSNDPDNCGGCGIVCDSGVCDINGCSTGECLCGSLCNIISLGSSVPQTAFGAVAGEVDQWIPLCVSGSGPDVVFSYFAPQTGEYTFDTSGSQAGVVLEIVAGGCFSYGCDSGGVAGGAFVSVFLGAGEQVFVVVDTQGLPGEVQLNINQQDPGCVTCGELIQGGDPLNLCPESEKLYDTLINCVCIGTCAMACVQECSMGGDLSMECEGCIFDAENGCGIEYNDCANDF